MQEHQQQQLRQQQDHDNHRHQHLQECCHKSNTNKTETSKRRNGGGPLMRSVNPIFILCMIATSVIWLVLPLNQTDSTIQQLSSTEQMYLNILNVPIVTDEDDDDDDDNIDGHQDAPVLRSIHTNNNQQKKTKNNNIRSSSTLYQEREQQHKQYHDSTPGVDDAGGVINDEWIEQCVDTFPAKKIVPFNPGDFAEYRLGDSVKFCRPCNMKSPGLDDATTIVQEYCDRACPMDHPSYRKGGNLMVLDEVIQIFDGKPGFERPDPDATVIHLRLGDKLEKSDANVTTMLQRGATPIGTATFADGIKSVYEYLDALNEDRSTASSSSSNNKKKRKDGGGRKVVIIGGSQKAEMYKKSRVYAGCLKKALVKSGYDVSMNLDSGDPDKDFYFLAHSKKIMVAPGGYSRFLGVLARRYGGEIVGRDFPVPGGYDMNPFQGLE